MFRALAHALIEGERETRITYLQVKQPGCKYLSGKAKSVFCSRRFYCNIELYFTYPYLSRLLAGAQVASSKSLESKGQRSRAMAYI